MRLKNIGTTGLFFAAFLVLTVAFNNCGKSKNSDQKASSSIDSNGTFSEDACENQLIQFYARSYQPFLVQNCSTCHTAGPGKGQFAHTDTLISYNDFMQIGYSKVSSNAVSDNHNPPYSGSQHTQTINSLKVTWLQALSEADICKGGDGKVDQNLSLSDRAHFALSSKVIPTMNDNETKPVNFDFAVDLAATKELPKPDLAGAKFQVMVNKVSKGTDRYYVVHSPRIYGGTKDVHIKGLFTKINGRYINYSTNFRYIDKSISKNLTANDTGSLVSTGGIVIAGAIFPDDALSFDIELIETTVIPPPPPPVVMSFSGATNVLADTTGEVSFTVTLNQPSTEIITFSISADSSVLCNGGTVNNSTCLPQVYNLLCPGNSCPSADANKLSVARSVVGDTFNRFDWDYKFSSTSFSFDPNQTTKTFTVKTSKDIRYEGNRLLTIKLEAGLGNITIPDAGLYARIAYNKLKNPVPPNGEVTYSQLMSNGGVLYNTCTSCHNSVKRAGGYDIQDYELMVSSDKRILVPGADQVYLDANDNKVQVPVSLMYRRTLPSFTIESLLMPRDKTLTGPEYNLLENWLIKGAKNN
jgi:hypothetical protein